MALAIATNTGALMAAASASSVNKDMETSMERLSTGKRINSAADDAAGVAIASRLSSEIRGTNQAIRNAMDAQGLINTAEGAHKEVENILQRMRELAVQAANDTNDSTDRTNLSAEMTQLTTEITRIATTSSWAGQALLNGDASTATPATATTQLASFNFQIGAGSKDQEQISVDVKAVTAEALGVSGSGTVATITNVASSLSGGTSTVSSMSVSTAGVVTFNSGSSTAIAAGSQYSFTVEGVDIAITVDATDSYADTAAGVAKQMGDAIVAADITGLNVAVNETAGTVTLTNGGSLSLTNATNARSAVNNIDSAIETLNTQRANLGAVSNRLDNTVSNLTNAVINLEAGKGRIEDADFAAESTALAKSQILQQASTAMLAQANASKQNVLSLLQG